MGYLTFREKHKIPTYNKRKHMQSGDLNFDLEKCNECGRCVGLCPGGCIVSANFTKMMSMAGEAKGKSGPPSLVTVNPDVSLCIACFCCGTACPQDAISIKRNFQPGFYFKRISQLSEMRVPKKY